jgi:hypothetical protein
MCEKLGCNAFVDFKETADTASAVKEITGGGGHAVIVTGGTASGASFSFLSSLASFSSLAFLTSFSSTLTYA